MGYVTGTILVILAYFVISISWQLWKKRHEIKARVQWYIMSKTAERALEGLMKSSKLKKVEGSHSANVQK